MGHLCLLHHQDCFFYHKDRTVHLYLNICVYAHHILLGDYDFFGISLLLYAFLFFISMTSHAYFVSPSVVFYIVFFLNIFQRVHVE